MPGITHADQVPVVALSPMSASMDVLPCSALTRARTLLCASSMRACKVRKNQSVILYSDSAESDSWVPLTAPATEVLLD